MQRIGVFVCWCGSNIAGTVDVKAVSEALKNEPGVVFSTNYQYMCSQAGQNLIKDAIKEHHLTGIVVCSCSPRMHENTFRKTAQSAGINPYMVEIANVREQCSWVHKDMATGTEKAIILGKAAVAKVNLNTPLTPGESPVTKRALVIGGGIAGIQTALDIADAGEPYHGETVVQHYLELLRDTVGFDQVKAKVQKPLTGKKVACYYGCLLLRPGRVMQMDDPENPRIMEDLIRALGGEPVVWAGRNECCGGYVALENEPSARKKSEKVLSDAQAHGADLIVTACPLCRYNLSKYSADVPVVYFTELLAQALGVEEEA